MKIKFLSFLVVAAVAVLIIVRLIQSKEQTAFNNEQTNNVPPSPGASPITQIIRTNIPRSPQPQDNWMGQPLPPGSNLQARLEELARRRGVSLNVLTQQLLLDFSNATRAAALQVNRPIELYGKVVGDGGESIAGANIHLGCISFPEQFFETNLVSDTQGMFALTGVSGTTLNVIVKKAGYEAVLGVNQEQFYFYDGSNTFRADPSNPVIFHLRKKP